MYVQRTPDVFAPLLDLLFERSGVGLCLLDPDGAPMRRNAEWLRAAEAAERAGADACRARVSRVALEDGRTLLISRCAGVSELSLVFGAVGDRASAPPSTPPAVSVPESADAPGAAGPAANPARHGVEAQFRALTEALPQIVCALHADGSPAYVNARWTEFSGLDLDESARAGWPGVVHPHDLAALRACWRRARDTREPQELELRYRRNDGTYRWFLSRIAPIRSCTGEVIRWIGVGTDIDDRKRVESERERLLASAQEADRRKNEFLGVLSHELRNPLAPIRNALHLLERVSPTSDGAQRAREVMARQVDHLTRLVDDLLDVTRISRGKVQLQRGPVELDLLVRRTIEDHRSLFTERGIELVIWPSPSPLWIDADATRVAQVVGNLLVNAAKFTDRCGRVTIRLAPDDAALAVITVSDTGIGIGGEVLARMFEPFVQGDRSLHRTHGGLGLGLALVKGLVEMHGGGVEAVSDGPGRGATFTIRLPLLAARASPAAGSPTAGDDVCRTAGERPGAAR